MNSTNDLLRVDHLQKVFTQGGKDLTIFDDLSFGIKRGEAIGLVGHSGSGKSTLLHQIGLLDTPTAGEVYLSGINVSSLKDNDRTLIRQKDIGFIYQFHHLQPEFSALENVMLPQMIRGVHKKKAKKIAGKLLNQLGLAERLSHRPARLSGGEQQRVAIARALANVPDVLFADEPTGNLDPHTAETVFGMLMTLVRETGLASLIATHNPELARQMDRVVTLRDGHLVELDPDTLS